MQVAILSSLFLYLQLAIKEAQVESCKGLIKELEKKMLGELEVRRKMKEKICEALTVEELEDKISRKKNSQGAMAR